jgi:hypothetical protein
MTNGEHEYVEGEVVDVSDEAIADFISKAEEAKFHPVIEAWREVLRPAEAEAGTKVTPQWASRICQSYSQITYGDMDEYRDRYFGKIQELVDILQAEIDSDPECLKPGSPEEDREHNSGHYKQLLLDWQLCILGWELAWTTTDPHAAVELAAISEVHKMFFGPTGLVGFLDNIKFEFTEEDQSEIAEALEELKAGSRE